MSERSAVSTPSPVMDRWSAWGIAPENEPDHPWQNITTFKRKLGGVDVGLLPTLDDVYDAAAYDRYLAGER